MIKIFFKNIITESNLLIIIPALLITGMLVGFLIFGLSAPHTTPVAETFSLLENQVDYESDFFTEYSESGHSKNNPYFVLDPYNISPLTGLIIFETQDLASFKLIIKGKTAEADIEFLTGENLEHFIPVYGLYPNYDNTIELYQISELEEVLVTTLNVTTSELPEEIVLPSLISTTYEYFGDDLMMLSPALDSLPVAFDFLGDVRWYLTTNLSWAPTILKDGLILLGTNNLISDPYHTTGFYEMDYLGKIYREYLLPGGYHHDIFEMDNGNLLVASSDFLGTVEDVIVEIERSSGMILKTWDLKDYLPQLEAPAEMWTSYDWFHNNSVFYDALTDSIILSGRHQDVVISIGYRSNELNWVLGDPENWESSFVEEYFFTPAGIEFEWQYGQHSAMVLDNGNIFLFDNGNNRSKLREFDLIANENYSRGVIYDIDTENMIVSQVYQFGKELGSYFYSPYISNVDSYSDGNYLIHSGGHSELGNEILNIPGLLSDYPNELNFNSITVEVLNNVIVYHLEVSDNFYQANRISLYTDYTSYKPGEASTLGNLAQTPTFDDKIETSFYIFDAIPKRYEIELFKERDRLVINGIFNKDEIIYIVLQNKFQTLEYHMPTSSNAYTAMCIGSYLDDERYLTFFINEEDIFGKFNIFIYVDGHKYNTYENVSFD